MAQMMFRMPSMRSAASVLAVALVAVSVVAAVVGTLQPLLWLVPAAVMQGFVWQLVTYGLIEASPMGVIFGGLIVWSIGGSLEAMWGRGRFLRFSAGVVVASAVATVLLSLLLPQVVRPAYPGGNVLSGALWVAFGLHLGRTPTNFWGFPLTGNVLALIGAGFVLLTAAFAGLSAVIPDVFALLLTWLWMRVQGPDALLGRFRRWRFNRDLERRSAHLKSLDGGRSGGRGSDKYLH